MDCIEHTDNSALPTISAFHYQVLVALDKCFSSNDYNAVWIEQDGDVSVIGDSIETSEQVEVKDYSSSNLTDNHHNFWNTLKNWLDPAFDHTHYGRLILHTTQPFGKDTRLSSWNDSANEQKRLDILKDIFSKRTQEELNQVDPSPIIKIQKYVMDSQNESRLQEIIGKVIIYTEACNQENLKKSLESKLDGFIPKANQETFIQALIGFVYNQSSKSKWSVTKESFNAKRLELTGYFRQKEFTFPMFSGKDASDEDVEKNKGCLFVQKIIDIDYESEIPCAVGNWLEYTSSLNSQLDEYPLYLEKTKVYKEKLLHIFERDYNTNCIKFKIAQMPKEVNDYSKIFYNETINKTPLKMEQYDPPMEYKNGIIHDAMNDDELNLKWKLEE